ncbi:MAG TPA: alkaline phosphatase family protein [Thermoanaerobaculia bacterium]|nr:alkaline phosphatase family protein [Thermoanaerobaculia bacterium]
MAAALAAVLGAAAACGRAAAPPPAPGASAAPAGAALAAASAPSAVPAPAAELARASRPGRRVLFVGLDGGDWQLLDGYMADGTMPTLAALARQGRSGVLQTIQPPLSPLVWTTMMTGVSPLEHRVLDFTRWNPDTGAREPIGSGERRVPAIWNMASAAGRSVAVFGLWATYPAEAVRGLMVADRFASFTARDRRPPPGVVFPPGRESWAQEVLASTVRRTGYQELHAYLPWLDAAEYERQIAEPDPYAHPVSALRRILAETRAYHALARAWFERARPDLAVVYFQGTDTLGHLFAPYAPPRQPGVTPEDFARYSEVPRRYFAEIDRLLGDFRDLASRQGAVLFLASDHGFRWREGRPAAAGSAAAATAARWHREEGIYLLWSPATAPGSAGLLPGSATARPPDSVTPAPPGARGRGGVAQVCATLLALLGLPPGAGLAEQLAAARGFIGKEGAGAAGGDGALPGPAAVAPVDYRRFFRVTSSPAATARAPGAGASTPSQPEDEQLAALRALGYIGAHEPGRRLAPSRTQAAVAADGTRTAASFDNEGLLLRQAGQLPAARAAFEQALARQPELPAALWNLSDLLVAEAEAGARIDSGSGNGSGAELPAAGRDALLDRSDGLLLRALAGGLPDGVEHALERASRYGHAGARDRALSLLERAAALRPRDPRLWLQHGRYRFEQQRCDAALADFTRALELDPASAVAHASAGLALLCRGDEPAALAAFRRSLALDPNQPEVRRFLDHPR